jgi:hypothetical protein
VSVKLVPELTAEPLERGLEPGVLERCDLAAALADDVVVVLPVGMRGLVAGYALTHLEPLDELHTGQQIERAIDTRDTDMTTVGPQRVEDLLGTETAVLGREELDHRRPGPARPVARPTKLVERVLAPVGLNGTHVKTIAGAEQRPTQASLDSQSSSDGCLIVSTHGPPV